MGGFLLGCFCFFIPENLCTLSNKKLSVINGIKFFASLDILGVPRPENEKDFANFDIFDDPSTPYSTFNFKYSHEAFERLSKLTEFNTLSNIEAIKKALLHLYDCRDSSKVLLDIYLTSVCFSG
jgi:hypothetical protein